MSKNVPSLLPACPTGFGDEEAIGAVWAADVAKSDNSDTAASAR
jgi:hypothetical protein